MQGLSSDEIIKRQQEFGSNSLPEEQGRSLLMTFVEQFLSPFIYVLLAAALVSFLLEHTINGIFVLAVLLLNATIGTAQEYSAQRAAQALKSIIPFEATVWRDGSLQKVLARDLVPGDRVSLTSGDKVPADLRLIEAHQLLVDESALTGESVAVAKHSMSEDAFKANSNAAISEQPGSVFSGTIVTHGRAVAEVHAIGLSTQIGRIAKSVTQEKSAKPPLLVRIEKFTRWVSYAVLVVIVILLAIALYQGQDITTVFLLGVALAVSAIPEGLPAAITIALAIGMRRMSKVAVIVRKLVSVEALGSCTYIASDKTGTLTINEMTITQLRSVDGGRFSVSGVGIHAHGAIEPLDGADLLSPTLRKLIMSGMLANESQLVRKVRHANNQQQTSTTVKWKATGDQVDIGFKVLAEKYGEDQEHADSLYPSLGLLPYESEQAFNASVNLIDEDAVLLVKGSPEKILNMCQLADLDEQLQQAEQLAAQGLRVIALAGKKVPANSHYSETHIHEQLHELEFYGFAGMQDPVRPDVKDAVQQCRDAKIKVAMITGDHPITAMAIATEIGIAEPSQQAVTGKQLAQANEQEFRDLVLNNQVFARVEPEQKLLIVNCLIAAGHFVAVTGDGVNDAPALRNAHVGVAMGLRGTDIAKESAELIISDDNFSSIVQGIKQGRIVYNNIRKVIFLLISTGGAEITLFIMSILLGYPIPLFPVQLLWLNLVTNGIQDIALAFEPEEGNELKKSPRAPQEPIFDRLMIERILINAMIMGVTAFVVFAYCLQLGMTESSARNVTLLLMVLFENVHVLNSRSETQSIFKQRLWSNPLLIGGMLCAQGIHIGAMYTPGLKDVLEVQPVEFSQWLQLLLIACFLIVVGEMHKWWLSKKRLNH
ncbi:MAG: cation-translocating P-type ATPase [Aestuariibacter sp.]